MGEKQSSWDFRAVYGVFVVGAYLVLARVTSRRRPVRDAVGAFPAAGAVGAVGAAPGDASSGSPAVPGTMLGDATPELSDARLQERQKGVEVMWEARGKRRSSC